MESKLNQEIKQILMECDAGYRKRQWQQVKIRTAIAIIAIIIWEAGGCSALGRQPYDVGHGSFVNGPGGAK